MMKQFSQALASLHRMGQGFFLSLFSLMVAFTLLMAPAQATGVYDLPVISPGESVWVVDQAETLSRANEGRLSTTLATLAEETEFELRMVAIRRLDYGETIEQLADQVFSRWFSDEESQSKQVLLVMDTLTHNTAIRVGNEARALLSDAIANSVVTETVALPLRDGKYNQALLEGSDRIIAVLSGQPDPGPPIVKEINVESTFTTAEETDDKNATIWVVGFLIVATIIPMVTYYWYVK